MSSLTMAIQSVEKEVYGEVKADPTKEAVKELRHELFERETAIENVIAKLEKASLVLSHWEQEYSFSEAPDPRAAIAYGSRVPDKNNPDIKGQQSYKWFLEYDYIFQFISIVSDYVYESKKLLEEAVYSKGDKQ